MPGPRSHNLEGQRFNMLTALRKARVSTSGQAYWLFRCDCGVEKEIRASHAKSGQIKSCGCSSGELNSAHHTKHGHWKGNVSSPEYSAWCLARARCHNSGNQGFPAYGARGITMCDRWRFGEGGKSGFECFIADMGLRPSREHSLDREDNNKGYSPDNCRWATREQQMRNTREHHYVTFDGRTMTAAEAADLVGLPRSNVWQRLIRGWDAHRALTTPIQVKRKT